jgi:hypothetical protein
MACLRNNDLSMQTGKIKNRRHQGVGKGLLLLAFLAILLLPRFSPAAMDEGRVRAAVIFHIISLTKWPEINTNPALSPTILILGQDPSGLADILTSKIKEAADADKTFLRVTSMTAPGEANAFANMLAGSQILYLTRDGMQYLPQLAPLVQKRPILTIGETEEFCENGTGMICLTIENQKLAIRINHKLTSETGFHFSAELLRHAVLVNK